MSLSEIVRAAGDRRHEPTTTTASTIWHPKVDILTVTNSLMIEHCPGPSFVVSTSRDSYAWNHRELATFSTVSKSLAVVGLEPSTVEYMGKNLSLTHPDS